MPFDIKFTRQSFENTCWHHEACRAIQRAFWKPSNQKTLTWYSIYQFTHCFTLQTGDNYVIFYYLCWFSVISDFIQKVQRHQYPINAHAVGLTTFIRQCVCDRWRHENQTGDQTKWRHVSPWPVHAVILNLSIGNIGEVIFRSSWSCDKYYLTFLLMFYWIY